MKAQTLMEKLSEDVDVQWKALPAERKPLTFTPGRNPEGQFLQTGFQVIGMLAQLEDMIRQLEDARQGLMEVLEEHLERTS